jgi:steroid 5-alpha reductase family enzyme
MSFAEVFTMSFFVLFGLAMLISSIGFYKFIYFISLGYGFSIAAIGVALIILFRGVMNPILFLMCVMFVIYGCRLGGYLAMREWKNASYRQHMKAEVNDGSTMPFFVKVCIWVMCALLYVLEVSPVFFRLQNGGAVDGITIVGAVIMACGILLESMSDHQKSAAKKINPKRFCDTGLFRIVRCPNYLGEMIFWTGVVITAIGAAFGWQWVVIAIGYVGIIFVMFSGARRLEIRQDKNYGSDPEYQKYVSTVPILLPFIPLYSVKKHKWLVA